MWCVTLLLNSTLLTYLNVLIQACLSHISPIPLAAIMSWLFLDWFVPLYLLVSVLVLAGFGACLYFLEPGLQDSHKWSNKTVRHHPLVASVNCRDDDRNALIWWGPRLADGPTVPSCVGGTRANTLKYGGRKWKMTGERRPDPSFPLCPDLFFYFAFEIREMWNWGV